jgi:indole-3-glycerol phosphate synthase
MNTAAPDLLAAIVAGTRRTVTWRRSREPFAALEKRAAERNPRASAFIGAISRRDRINVIAECKRRSPSRGVLRHAYDPVMIASSYEAAGAAAVSVLTEPTFFDGSLEHLLAIRAAIALPLLRKDFIVDEYQLLEARANGADAALLIVAAMTDSELRALLVSARELDLAALVEVHAADELDRALSAGANIIGVNNRNLRTLEVDVHASEQIGKRLPGDVIAISESGLRSTDDLMRLRASGYHAFLVGERFMSAADPGDALRALLTHDVH